MPVPAGVVTDTVTAPTECAGVVAVIEVSLTTETVSVDPSRLALTTTPSMGPSAAELT